MIFMRNQKEVAANDSSKHWKALLENIAEYATSVLDGNGHVYKWSSMARSLTGFTAKEIIGKHYSIFYSKKDIEKRLPQKILSTAARRGLCETEGLRVRKDGTLYWTSGMIVAIRDKNKELYGYARFSRDATREHEARRQRDEFLSIAAHELKTPVTTLNLYAQLLKDRMLLSRDKENLSMLQDIEDQSMRLVKLVNDLLTVSAIQAGRFALREGEFDICALSAKTAKVMQKSGTHEIKVKCEIKGKVRGDPDRIEEVLVNLLSNAMKYSPRERRILVHITRRGRKALLAVTDRGQGITKQEQKSIFKRYFQAARKRGSAAGFGLGLYISAEIIKRHRQKIWFNSAPGKGSTFYFTLDLAK